MAGDGSGRVNDLTHGEALVIAQVEDLGGAALAEIVEAEDVGLGEIGDMDVVADAGAVGGVVVGAEDGDGRSLTEGGLEDEGDEVGFGGVVFAEATLGIGSGGVEVAEDDGLEAVGGVEVPEDLFDHLFAVAVGVDGGLGMVFVDGEVVGNAVGGAGGGKDEVGDVVVHHGFEEGEGGDDVVAVVFGGILDGFSHVGVGGEVHDCADRVGLEDLVEAGSIADVADDEGNLENGFDEVSVAVDEVIEDHNVIALGFEGEDGVGSDVAGSAGDEDGRSIGGHGAYR